ncbi:MAG: efflux RND transporter periplasmic adaptor subunit [Myxococcales bacterium]|nr:efflux RND transporter periplasmic adaptor subunit [Myxococcales bacterium]
MSKTTKSLLWLALAVLAAAVLLVPRLRSGGEAAGPGAGAPLEPLEVEVLAVAPHRIVERFSTIGTIQADERVEIRSEISGILKRVLFAEGSRVASGQSLVEIDDVELAAERDRALHRVELARLREARQQDLLAQGLTSQEDYDLALSQLNVLAAELRLAEAQLAKTRIRAPFPGVIGLRAVSPGASITPQTPIATLQKLDPVKVEFSVPENYAGQIRPGDVVAFRVRGSAGDYEGSVYAVEPNVDRETRSLRVRARCPNPQGELLPGAFADVELEINVIEDALTVPALAVIPELGSKKVFVVEEGRAVPRLVETGVRTETEVEITHGLEVADRVIVSAIQRLNSGLPVRERIRPVEGGEGGGSGSEVTP